MTTAVATSLVHTLIPDHWLPFVLIGRARGWSARRTALVSGFSGMVHAGLSVLLALLALGMGVAAARAVGGSLERASTLFLVVFGLLYAAWAWRKGGHFHPGGARVHARQEAAGCPGTEGPSHPAHLHYHADDGLIREGSGLRTLGLALIVGANPCVLLIPLLLAAVSRGTSATLAVTLAYAVPTVLLIAGLSTLGVIGTKRIRLPGAARHMEPLSGLLIAALGIGFLLFGE